MSPAQLLIRPFQWRDGLSRGKLTWLVASALFVAYWTYSLSVAPLVRPPGVGRAMFAGEEAGGDGPPLPNLEIAARYLPHVPWARSPTGYQFSTASSYVYAKDWEPVDNNNAIRFTPFAMVWMQKGRKPDEDPITVVADSAYVRFAEKFSMSNPNPGRVIGGSLEGRVEIRGPNGLQVRGRDFSFSEKSMRMWSDSHLTFAHGPHRGQADGMECELLPRQGPRRTDEFAVGGVQNIRLRKNVAMDLMFEPGAQKKGPLGAIASETPLPAARGGTTKGPVPVRVRSKGSFDFGVQTNVATFEDDVRVLRPTKPGKFDILLCDELTLIFEPETPASPNAKTTPAKKKGRRSGERFQFINGRLTFNRLQARPRLPRRQVVLISEDNQLTARMEDLKYDAPTKTAVLRDRESVQVKQESSETRAPKITLRRDPDTSATSLLCEGAGWIRHFDKKTGRPDLFARWKKRLHKFPDPHSDLDVVDLKGDAFLQQPLQQSHLRADLIRIWMDRRRKERDGKRPRLSLAEEDRPPRRDASRGVKLRRMLALDHVALQSPQMHAHASRLEAWFEHDESGANGPPPSASSRSDLLPTMHRQSRRRPVRFRQAVVRPVKPAAFASVAEGPRLPSPQRGPEIRPAVPPGAGGVPSFSAGRSGKPLPSGKREPPMLVWADLIRVLIRQGRSSKDTQVRKVWMRGGVRVLQDHERGEKPLNITGDELRIESENRDDHVVHVYGNPAHVRDRGMHIEGDNVHLDRQRNRSWVEGKGVLRVPVGRSLDGRKLNQPQLLDVWWKKGMTFDGETARFRGQVRAIMEDSRLRCQEIDVALSRRISFAQRPGAERGRRSAGDRAEKPQVQTIVCRDGVEFASYEYDGNTLTQYRKGRVEQFTVHQDSGDTEAQGPGWMAAWRRGKGKRRGFGGLAKVQANRAAVGTNKGGWDYTRVDFGGDAVGNLKQRYNRFRDHVEVVYGPVDRPPHVIDADELPPDAGWLRSRELTVTQHEKTPRHPSYFTMQGAGNAYVRGRDFHARADTITYDESHDLYVLRSLGRRNATIWRQTQPGGERSRADARRMQFIPSQNALSFDKAENFNGLR